MVTFSIQRLARDDGASLAFYTWPSPPQPIKAAVQIAHGLAEHAARYDRFAQALGRAGYAVFANDHRGHGQTAVQNGAQLGHLPAPHGFQRVVDDLYAVNRRIAAEHPNVPRILFAHSFGSFAAQQYMGTYGDSIAAVVLSGTNSGVGPLAKVGTLIASVERLRLGSTATSALLQQMSFGNYNKAFAPTRTESDWLSRDPVEVDKYRADPLCGFPATTETWHELTRALTRIEDPAFQSRVPKALPVYLFAGDLDPVGRAGRGPKKLSQAYTRAGLKDVTLRLYPGARHELLNEINRDEVTSDVIAWLDDHVARATR